MNTQSTEMFYASRVCDPVYCRYVLNDNDRWYDREEKKLMPSGWEPAISYLYEGKMQANDYKKIVYATETPI